MWEVSNKDQIVSNTNSMDFISIKRAPILLIFNAVNISKLMTFDAGQDLSFQAPGDSIRHQPNVPLQSSTKKCSLCIKFPLACHQTTTNR